MSYRNKIGAYASSKFLFDGARVNRQTSYFIIGKRPGEITSWRQSMFALVRRPPGVTHNRQSMFALVRRSPGVMHNRQSMFAIIEV